MDDEQLFRFFTINLCWKRDAQLIQVYPWKEGGTICQHFESLKCLMVWTTSYTQTPAQTIFYGLRVQKFRSCNHKWWCLGFCWRWCQQKNREVHCHSRLLSNDVNSTAGRFSLRWGGFLRCATARFCRNQSHGHGGIDILNRFMMNCLLQSSCQIHLATNKTQVHPWKIKMGR